MKTLLIALSLCLFPVSALMPLSAFAQFPTPNPTVTPEPEPTPAPDDDDDAGDDDDDDGGNGEFETGELAGEGDQEDALKEWEAASLKAAKKQVRRGFWLAATGTLGVAGATFLGIQGVDSASKRDDAAAVCAQLNDPDSAACADSVQFGQQTSAYYAGAAALGVAGITLATVGAHNIVVGRRVKAKLTPVATPKGAMLILHGEF